jgi:hypothetical protein
MRQTQAIALSQAYQPHADQSIAVTLAGIENDTALSYLAKFWDATLGEPTPQETSSGYLLAAARFIHWENLHYQYQQGFVSDQHWKTALSDMHARVSDPVFRDLYERNRGLWRASFREVLEPMFAGERPSPGS